MSITKIKKKASKLFDVSMEIKPGWEAVLADIYRDVDRLQTLAFIVERKIERGEPWPGESATPPQNARQRPSVGAATQ